MKTKIRAALIRMIKFEAKKVSMNENGSFSLYAAKRIWTPKIRNKMLKKIHRICLIQKIIFGLDSFISIFRHFNMLHEIFQL